MAADVEGLILEQQRSPTGTTTDRRRELPSSHRPVVACRSITPAGAAVWVTSWPLAEYTRHGRGDAWVCTLFRNEGAGLSSELIVEADASRVASRNPGYCFLMAGFQRLDRLTKDRRLVILHLPSHEHPAPIEALGTQGTLLAC